jgi:hypothetical protein
MPSFTTTAGRNFADLELDFSEHERTWLSDCMVLYIAVGAFTVWELNILSAPEFDYQRDDRIFLIAVQCAFKHTTDLSTGSLDKNYGNILHASWQMSGLMAVAHVRLCRKSRLHSFCQLRHFHILLSTYSIPGQDISQPIPCFQNFKAHLSKRHSNSEPSSAPPAP